MEQEKETSKDYPHTRKLLQPTSLQRLALRVVPLKRLPAPTRNDAAPLEAHSIPRDPQR